MKRLLISILFVSAISAYAENKSLGKTQFEIIGDLFEAGTLPDPTQISNVAWSGRCFYANTPNEAHNGGYIIRESEASGSFKYEAITYLDKNQGPDYFDNRSLRRVMATIHPLTFLEVTILQNWLEIKINKFISQLKISGPYLIENLLHSTDEHEATFARCYYFIANQKNNLL